MDWSSLNKAHELESYYSSSSMCTSCSSDEEDSYSRKNGGLTCNETRQIISSELFELSLKIPLFSPTSSIRNYNRNSLLKHNNSIKMQVKQIIFGADFLTVRYGVLENETSVEHCFYICKPPSWCSIGSFIFEKFPIKWRVSEQTLWLLPKPCIIDA